MTVFWLLGTYAGGILLAGALRSVPTPEVSALALCLFAAWFRLRKSVWALLPAGGIFLLLGVLWAGQAHLPPRQHDHVSRFITEQPCVIEGTMRRAATFHDGRSRFELEVSKVLRGTRAAQASGLVRVSVGEGQIPAIEGQTLRLRSRLRAPRNFGSPGEFDWVGHLAGQDIFVTAYLADAAQAVVIDRQDRSKTTVSMIAAFRRSLAERIEAAVPVPEAGLVQALVIGMRDGVTPAQRRFLSEGGVAHLFAISGLHFGMLALLLYVGCRWLYRRSTRLLLWCPPRRVIPLLLILPMGGYLLLSGNGLAARRAFLMTTAASLLYSGNRRTGPLQLLASAALAILLFEPLALFRPAFQLSFAGLAGILFWLPGWQSPLNRTPAWVRWPALLCLTTLAATLATAPLTLWHFQTFAPASLLTNLAATPIIAWGAVPLGLAGVLLSSFAPQAAETCFAAAGYLTACALQIVAWLISLPGLAAIRYFPSQGDLWAAILLLAALTVRGRRPARWLLRCSLAAGALCFFLPPAATDPTLRIVAFSVGQGDATLVSLGQGHDYLIDGGGMPRSSFDPGERLIAPALGRLKVRKLKGVLLTHDHPDHLEGLHFILDHFPVDKVYSGIPAEDLEPALLAIIKRRNIPLEILSSGWCELDAGDKARLSIFTPRQDHNDINERSLAVYAGFGTEGVLLTGDMGPASLRQLKKAGMPGPTTLLKLPHHGSRASLPARFLTYLNPRLAFVSAGRNNSHRLPHPATVSLCEDLAIPLCRTDLQGTLTFASNGRGWAASCGTHGFFIDEY